MLFWIGTGRGTVYGNHIFQEMLMIVEPKAGFHYLIGHGILRIVFFGCMMVLAHDTRHVTRHNPVHTGWQGTENHRTQRSRL